MKFSELLQPVAAELDRCRRLDLRVVFRCGIDARHPVTDREPDENCLVFQVGYVIRDLANKSQPVPEL